MKRSEALKAAYEELLTEYAGKTITVNLLLEDRQEVVFIIKDTWSAIHYGEKSGFGRLTFFSVQPIKDESIIEQKGDGGTVIAEDFLKRAIVWRVKLKMEDPEVFEQGKGYQFVEIIQKDIYKRGLGEGEVRMHQLLKRFHDRVMRLQRQCEETHHWQVDIQDLVDETLTRLTDTN